MYTKSTLNAFGEVKLIDYPDSRHKSIEKRYCDSSCSLDGYYIQRVAETGKPDKEVVFDKYGMEIETRVVSFDGSNSVVTTTYDEYGRKESTSRPNNPALTTDFVYDDIGRVERVTNPDGSYKTLEYDGANEIATNEIDQKTTTVKNGLGETIEVEDNEGNTVEFTYDAFGNLLNSETKADGKSSIITNEFDYLGRKTSTDDPIKGEWTYKYNGFDQIYSQTNAENDKFTFTYDTLGRKTKSYNSEEGTLCWIYGTSSTYKERNKLVETAKYDGADKTCGSDTPTIKTEYSFDSVGRPHETVTTFEGEFDTYSQSQSYDAASRPLITNFDVPGSSFSVKTFYTNAGYVKARVNNETGFVLERIDSMNDSGQVTGITYGNGVEGQYDFEGDTGRLSDVDFIGDSSLFNLDLTYYNNGDLHTKRSKYYSGDAADYTETFIYDDVSRLKNRNISVITANPALPSSFTGNQTYTYDGFGNITSKKGFGTNGTSTGYYKYSSTDVHRLEAIYKNSSRTGATYNNFSGKYDNNGNIENDGVRTFTYSSFDLPTDISSSTASATMKYGVNRQLYYKSESKKENGLNATYTRTYVGGYEKTIRSGGYGSLTEHKYYIGNAIVTKRSNQTDEILYMHKDS
ncbi:hypothetical protein [Psychrosphaera algicola]|uniref:RHS repeat protein n=1 Tax=Psychrosphaera algicola TaxID=3023714 RepID=A0ABT5FFM9_9GAMM|nr:hypothetical protein [Psychrosphaera sp. G1-22]MDC2890354.1 hypothetical protein [Psychrosphaera sp. G1-22]